MNLDVGLIALSAATVLSWGCWRLGREFPSRRRLAEVYGERVRLNEDRLQEAYDEGWDASALAHTELVGQAHDDLTVVLSTGRGAADDDGPAPLPAPPMMCPGGARCIRGPEPHEWSTDCEYDEGWADLPGPDRTSPASTGGFPRAGETHREDWYETMHRELAPEEMERPATTTDQFQAVFTKADGLERECLLTWDSTRRYDRSRPDFLREAGISSERIRELLGSE